MRIAELMGCSIYKGRWESFQPAPFIKTAATGAPGGWGPQHISAMAQSGTSRDLSVNGVPQSVEFKPPSTKLPLVSFLRKQMIPLADNFKCHRSCLPQDLYHFSCQNHDAHSSESSKEEWKQVGGGAPTSRGKDRAPSACPPGTTPHF